MNTPHPGSSWRHRQGARPGALLLSGMVLAIVGVGLTLAWRGGWDMLLWTVGVILLSALVWHRQDQRVAERTDQLRTALVQAEQLATFRLEDAVDAVAGMVLEDSNGVELAGRVHERSEWRDLPTVLVTSWGSPMSRERAREAGLDAILTKPFTQPQIREVLVRWLPDQAFQAVTRERDPSAQSPVVLSPTVPVPPASHLDAGVLEGLRELERTGATGLFRKLGETWLESSYTLVESIQAASVEGDAEALGQAAHALKSSSANVGAMALSAMCAELEARGRRDELEGVTGLVEALWSEFGAVQRALATELDGAVATALPVAKSKGPTILVIDDEPMMRQLVQGALSAHGYRVIEAGGGVQGLIRFEQDAPDLVLLDIVMADLDGFEVCRRIRASERNNDLPVVCMTGLGDEGSIQRAYDVGATDFVAKPFSPRLLRNRVAYLLRAANTVRELRRNQASFSMAERVAGMGNWTLDLATRTVEASDHALVIAGFRLPANVSALRVFRRNVHPDDLARLEAAVRSAVDSRKPYSVQFRVTDADGTQRVVEEQGEVVPGDVEGALRLIGTMLDITDRSRREERIHRLAYFDEITGLPNRTLFTEVVDRALERLRAGPGQVAVLFVGVDRLRRINDTLGHAVGDDLLRQVARRLQGCLPGVDWSDPSGRDVSRGLLARFGGDEFGVVLPGLHSPDDARVVARRLLQSMRAPFSLAGHEVFTSAGVGIAVGPMDGTESGHLFRGADIAMTHARQPAREDIQMYSDWLDNSAWKRLSLESDLRRAIAQGELVVYYQPKLSVATGAVIGCEALVRWQHPERGLVSPGEFIAVAEETGLIRPLGEFVLATAAADCLRWHELGLMEGRVSVNVSANQFLPGDLIRKVRQILLSTGTPGELIELEVTESLIMENIEAAKATMDELRTLGITFAIDDFGTGYSSLKHLRRFSIDALKVDQSFVKNLDGDIEDAIIASTIVALGQALGMRVVAEGVETEAQLEFLQRQGCDEFQGFLVSRPVPVEAFEAFLINEQAAEAAVRSA